MGIASWFPHVATMVTVVTLTLTLIFGRCTGVEPFAFFPCLVCVIIKDALRWPSWVTTGLFVGWAVVLGSVMNNAAVTWLMAVFITIAASLGLLLRYLLVDRVHTKYQLATAEREAALARRSERDHLSRELHDVVGNKITVANWDATLHAQSQDVSELQGALTSVEQTTRVALTELRSLTATLREPAVDGTAHTEPTQAIERPIDSPFEEIGAQIMTDPRRGNRHITVTIDPGVSALEPSLQTVALRVIEEAWTNITKHTAYDSDCVFSVSLEPDQIYIKITNSMPESPLPVKSWLTSKIGLHSMRERVELLGGQFSAGAVNMHWVVEASLPRG